MTWRLLLILALWLSGAAAFAESPTLTKIRETGIVTIGYREASIPFSYLDDRQRPVGYSIDICMRIVDAIRSKLQMPEVEVKFTPVTSANRIPLIENDIIDFECGSTTNTADRQKQIAFTLTTFVAENSLVSRKAANIRGLADLAGRTVATTAGTTSAGLLANLNRERGLAMNIVIGNDHADSFQMVATDRADAFVMDDVLLHGLVASAKRPGDFRVVSTGLSVEPYGMALRKGDPEFKKLADDTIAGLFASGDVRKIYARWFQAPIPPRGINLSLPMNRAFRRLLEHPTDSPDPAKYR